MSSALVTGASSGLGLEIARGLARRGFRVLLLARDAERGRAACAAILRGLPEADLTLHVADLSSLAEIERVAGEVRARHDGLDVLVNNAAGLFGRRTLSADGLEMTFALNHLAYFALTLRLAPPLRAAAGARVVNVSSSGHRRARIDWDDLQLERGYWGFRAYRNTKLMNILFTKELARLWGAQGITANAVNPGLVKTGIARGGAWWERAAWHAQRFRMVDAEAGAGGPLRLATDPALAGITGAYFDRAQAAAPAAAARDAAAAARLWALSAELTGLGRTP